MSIVLLTLLLHHIPFGRTAVTGSSPTVDLGYAVHEATFDPAANLFNFSNIYYASAPLFELPQPITAVNRSVNGGQTPGICPQSTPWWEVLSGQMSAPNNHMQLEQVNNTFTQIQTLYDVGDIALSKMVSVPTDPRTVQECLTLDVIVPKSIWNERASRAPVLVWIYGGGYVSGDKNSVGDPTTLITQSVTNTTSGVVFVTLNYRLGMFGWLSGPQFQSQGGTSNLGLHDQRAALEWVQRYIHLFGGDPNRITVMGESAGGASIMHHLTAGAGFLKAPFNQAIIQSPAFPPVPGTQVQDHNFNMVLKWAGILNGSQISTLAQLREVPLSTLLQVNQITTAPSYWGSMTWGPVVDGEYVPELPGVLLQYGFFDDSVKVITGRNSNEGQIFGSPLVSDETQYLEYLSDLLPTASKDTISYINNDLYPPTPNASDSQSNSQTYRQIDTITDSVFICNTRYIDVAYSTLGAWGYYFDIPPGDHAQDLAYTFYNPGSATTINETVAKQMQGYFTQFAQTGSPNAPGLPQLVPYGDGSMLRSLYTDTIVQDSADTKRCSWWQKAFYAREDEGVLLTLPL